jgi:hypothetical protein
MNDFTQRQCQQAFIAIENFRSGKGGLNTFMSRIEGISRVLGDDFWAEKIFPHALTLEQINAEVIESHRALTLSEREQVEALISKIEKCFSDRNRAID